MPVRTSDSSVSGRGRGVGLGLALLSAVAFGGSGVAAKPLIEAGLDPLHVVWLRVAGAALVMLPLAVRHRALLRRRPGLLVGFGLLAVAGVQACYFAALSRIPVGVALLIEYLAPALVLGWVRFVQKRPVTRAAAVGVVLAVGGLACVVEVWSGLGFDALGLLLALGAACCQVGYFVLSDQGSDAGDEAPDPLGVIAYGLLVGAAVLTVVARPWTMDWSVLGGTASMDGRPVAAVVLLAWIVLVATVVAYVTGVVSVRGSPRRSRGSSPVSRRSSPPSWPGSCSASTSRRRRSPVGRSCWWAPSPRSPRRPRRGPDSRWRAAARKGIVPARDQRLRCRSCLPHAFFRLRPPEAGPPETAPGDSPSRATVLPADEVRGPLIPTDPGPFPNFRAAGRRPTRARHAVRVCGENTCRTLPPACPSGEASSI